MLSCAQEEKEGGRGHESSSTTSSEDDESSGDDTVGGSHIGGSAAETASALATIAAAEERRRQIRRLQTAEGTDDGTPRLRDPLGVKPPWRKPELDSFGSGGGGGGGDEDVVDPVQLVWDKLSARHQCFIDRWPPDEVVSEGEEEEQREAGSGPSPQVGAGWAARRTGRMFDVQIRFFFLWFSRALVMWFDLSL